MGGRGGYEGREGIRKGREGKGGRRKGRDGREKERKGRGERVKSSLRFKQVSQFLGPPGTKALYNKDKIKYLCIPTTVILKALYA